MLNSNKSNTKSAKLQGWVVATQWDVEPLDEMVGKTRSSDGRWLKVNCKLNAATFTQSSSNMALAELFDCSPDELFIGKRR